VRRAVRVATALAREDGDDNAPLVGRLTAAFESALGVRRDHVPDSGVATERHAAVVALLELAEDLVRADPDADVASFLAEVERRTTVEAGGEAAGVELLTYHRAKGLEWDAVFLPALEEGTLPIRQATEPAELAEERRLLYVGLTRAKSRLFLSWSAGGKPSRFLAELGVRKAAARATETTLDDASAARFAALKRWRLEQSRSDGVPAYVVFSNRTLEEIARVDPETLGELAAVSGVGPTKLESYGERVLAELGARNAGVS
jgi:ATP-dependent DNA helicase UvrD/PcrA